MKAKLKGAKNIGEAVTIAKAAGFDITEDEAKEFAAKKKSGELSDDELENVAGGGCEIAWDTTRYGHILG